MPGTGGRTRPSWQPPAPGNHEWYRWLPTYPARPPGSWRAAAAGDAAGDALRLRSTSRRCHS
eukprot:11191073-Lingulodinium_polyedra.AAC.1